jgi:hypothetical protein
MSANKLEDISWYVDPRAQERGEPGIYHSYMACLATALNYLEGEVDPAWLMGGSGFAFRIFMNETMCPSAMSIFNWSSILPEAVEQAGYDCVYVTRLWDEDEVEEERRVEAHVAIVEGIDRGAPAIVWDLAGVEWGLIIGYDERRVTYATLTSEGEPSSLPYTKLGRNGIDILSVAIPGKPSGRARGDVVLSSLKVAVAHAEGWEWADRPKYQNGLAGLDLYATLYDRWTLLAEAGKTVNLPKDVLISAEYYAGHHYSARCYARDYLRSIAGDDRALRGAASCYEEVADKMKPVWQEAHSRTMPDAETAGFLARCLRDAKAAEAKGIDRIGEYLSSLK